MNTQYLSHKGYLGTIEPQIKEGYLYGKIAFIRDLVTYEADTLPELVEAFITSVEGYLSDCVELGREPDMPFKGSLNVRLGPELHRAAALAADQQSLNAFICDAIREKLVRLQSPEMS